MLICYADNCYRMKNFSFCGKYLHATTITTALFPRLILHCITYYSKRFNKFCKNVRMLPSVSFLKCSKMKDHGFLNLAFHEVRSPQAPDEMYTSNV